MPSRILWWRKHGRLRLPLRLASRRGGGSGGGDSSTLTNSSTYKLGKIPLGLASRCGGGPGGGGGTGAFGDKYTNGYNFKENGDVEGISVDAGNETTTSSSLCRRRSVWTYCCPGIATGTAATANRLRDKGVATPRSLCRHDSRRSYCCCDCLLSCRRFSLGFCSSPSFRFREHPNV